MNNLFQMTRIDLVTFGRNSNWFLGWGIALTILGILAIVYATFTTLLSVVLLGAILLIGGGIMVVDAFQFWKGKGSNFYINLLIGLLYVLTGAMLINNPVLGSLSLTLLLAIFFTCLGIARIIYHLSHNFPRRGWGLFNGVITLILGVLLFAKWPASGLFVIGLFIGIELLLCGWVYIMAALSTRNALH